jgi:hypothetical protein
MICCGQERKTSFCPECGSAVGTTHVHDLLTHLRGAYRGGMEMAAIEAEVVRATLDPETKSRCLRRQVDAERNANCFNVWANALAELIAKNREGK